MNHASLFSGIGGFDLAAEWMGWTNVFNCEWEDFPRQVLKHHFPNATQHEDIKDLDASDYYGRIDILTGGFPCQPYSTAGKRLGTADERHLWPEMLRVIRECSPSYVVGENVRGLVSWNGGLVFEEVCADLEAEGYAVQPFVLPACGVNAPHRRDRVWFVAYSNDKRRSNGHGQVQEKNGEIRQRDDNSQLSNSSRGNASNTLSKRPLQPMAYGELERRQRPTKRSERTTWDTFPTVAPICGRNDGLPKELDGISIPKWRQESIKAYGNAIVPQVALQIFKAIEAHELLV